MNFEVQLFSVGYFIELLEKDKLNLNPAFQRNSVWRRKDKEKLIQSIFENYTIPSIFLCKSLDKKYIVIDGKQRLEAIFDFYGCNHGKSFSIKLNRQEQEYSSQKKDYKIDYKILLKRGYENDCYKFLAYKIPVIIISDYTLEEMQELFVRINSTGKHLTKTEIMNAKYMKTNFLKEAKRLASKNYILNFFKQNKILSDKEIERMKNIEIICEMMAFIIYNSVLDKKKVMGNLLIHDEHKSSIKKAIKIVPKIIKNINKILPELSATRFKKLSDFYSLAYFIYDLTENEKRIINLTNRKIAEKILIEFSNQMDKFKQTTETTYDCEKYFNTITNATDSKSQRQKRFDILKKLLENIFVEIKDNNRVFSESQKRLIYNASKTKRCKKCGRKLTFASATFDHIKPYSFGGKTEIENAQLLCQSCNSSKGNKY